MRTYHTFKNAATMEKHLRTREYKEDEWDFVRVAGIVFTMDEFDSDGEYITWGNKRHDKQLRVETSDRYSKSTGFTDAKVYLFCEWGLFRNDIAYYE